MKAITRGVMVDGKPSHVAVIVATPAEAQLLINAIDALHRETGEQYGEIREQLVTAAYRRIQ